MYSKRGLYKDPFVKYKPEVEKVKRNFLNAEELEVMANKKLVSDWVSQVRDIFLFICYTGLADADVKKLKRSEIVTGDRRTGIGLHKPSENRYCFPNPFTSPSNGLMAKYEDNPQCVNDGLLLPVLSNQKMNRYLKEIADACGTRSR